MFKPISRRWHAFTDYLYIPAVAAAPRLLRFEDEKTAARLCQFFSAKILISSLFTRAEWGLFKIMPYRYHVLLDFLSGISALTMPWVFGFADNKKARNTFLAMGTIGILVGLLSEIEEMD